MGSNPFSPPFFTVPKKITVDIVSKMIQFYQLKNRVISRILSPLKKIMRCWFMVHKGLYKLFTQLFERNVYINQLKGNMEKNINFYKHNPSPKIDNYIKFKPIVFVLYKEFDLWIESLKKPMDFLIINKKFDYNISTVSDIENLQKYHSNFYKFWINNKYLVNKLEFVNFRDMLEEDKVLKYIEYIKNKYNLTTSSKYFIPKKVHHSDNFDKEKYLNYKLKKSDLDNQINLLISKNND